MRYNKGNCVMKKSIIIIFICFMLLCSGCEKPNDFGGSNGGIGGGADGTNSGNYSHPNDSSAVHEHTYDGVWLYDQNSHWQAATCEHSDEKGYLEAHSYSLLSTDAYGYTLYRCNVCGYEKSEKSQVIVNCVQGSADCYTVSDDVITFSGITQDSVYSLSGIFSGSILIDVNDDYKFEIELQNFSLYSSVTNPITAIGGDKIKITAKKDTLNYIYDLREQIDDTNQTLHKAAVYCESDLSVQGKGSLSVISENNNGIHSKDDLEVKNLNLSVNCQDNALKGNDSVTLTDCNAVLIAKTGDGIKTSNSDISSKGKQRGSVKISGGSIEINAACDGIDAAYNAEIDQENTNITIYTDKYSQYSQEVTDVSNNVYYIRYNNQNYNFSVKYYNSDDDYIWENASFFKNVSFGREKYYYYSFAVRSGYQKIKVFVYNSSQEQGQETNYVMCSDYLTWNTLYDTLVLSSHGYSWTNYTTAQNGFGGGPGGGHGGPSGGFGGMDGGNTDKGDHSTKGIKAANEVVIYNGTISIKSYDDAIHANNGELLENGEQSIGNVNILGGKITLYSNDDGIHADGTVTISGGDITVTNSYEGVEGNKVVVSNGNLYIVSLDDGINGTGTSGTSIEISGGNIYVYAGGDGVDSNSMTSYSGIAFSGGTSVIISTSNGNSAIDTERGYSYTGGSVLAVMPSRGMTNEITNCSNFSSVATRLNKSVSVGVVVSVSVAGQTVLSAEMPCALSATMVYLGSNAATISVK